MHVRPLRIHPEYFSRRKLRRNYNGNKKDIFKKYIHIFHSRIVTRIVKKKRKLLFFAPINIDRIHKRDNFEKENTPKVNEIHKNPSKGLIINKIPKKNYIYINSSARKT